MAKEMRALSLWESGGVASLLCFRYNLEARLMKKIHFKQYFLISFVSSDQTEWKKPPKAQKWYGGEALGPAISILFLNYPCHSKLVFFNFLMQAKFWVQAGI